MQTNNLPETGLLRLHQVLAIFPVSKSTWYAGQKAGKYPRSVKLSTRASGWRRSDIEALCASLGSGVNND